jgi:hypothetical protein
MDHKKFEKLIDLIINENEEQARELFHDIVVEKSREIYESIMEEEMMDGMEEGMGGQVGDLLDEINVDEAGGVYEDEDEDDDLDDMLDSDDEETEVIDIEDEGDDEDHDEVEDAVIRIEDKLDQLMAEFEDIMGGGDDESDSEFDDDAEEAGKDLTRDMEQDRDEEEAMMENVQLQKVSVTHGDNGVQRRSTVDANSGQAGMASRPVKFSGYTEVNPTGPKQPHDYLTKGEGQVKGAGSFKNVPGQKSQDLSSAPKAVTKDAATGTRSPVAESRKRR